MVGAEFSSFIMSIFLLIPLECFYGGLPTFIFFCILDVFLLLLLLRHQNTLHPAKKPIRNVMASNNARGIATVTKRNRNCTVSVFWKIIVNKNATAPIQAPVVIVCLFILSPLCLTVRIWPLLLSRWPRSDCGWATYLDATFKPSVEADYLSCPRYDWVFKRCECFCREKLLMQRLCV